MNFHIFENFNIDQILSMRMFQFFKEFDLLYSKDNQFEIEFFNYLILGNYTKPIFTPKTKSIPKKKKLVDINELFYEGFYNE